VQSFSARREDAHARTFRYHLSQQRPGGKELLEIVEQQQQFFASQMGDEAGLGRPG